MGYQMPINAPPINFTTFPTFLLNLIHSISVTKSSILLFRLFI